MNSSAAVVDERIIGDCPICFDDINATKNCIITECGHKFHASCLLRSVAHENFDCPCCRFELTERPEESDDGFDEENYDDDDEISDEIMQSMRWMFQRAEGEELEDEYVLEEDEQIPDVPVSYISENLTSMNYSFEDMIKIILNDFLDSDQDERSISILNTIDGLVDRYEETSAPTSAPTTTPTSAPTTDDEDSDNDEDSNDKVSEDLKTFVPKINFNVVKRYQATSYLCGNN
jgi:hypothetical protein